MKVEIIHYSHFNMTQAEGTIKMSLLRYHSVVKFLQLCPPSYQIFVAPMAGRF